MRRMPYDALRESQCHRPDRQHCPEQNPDFPVCEYFHTAPLPIPFTSLKKLDKELAKLESKKKDAETKAAESAKKAEAEDVLKKLLASGMTADEILEKLK